MDISITGLRPEYERLYASATIRPSRAADVDAAVRYVLANLARYRAVEAKTGVPAHFIGALHWREGSGNFATHLHNGDRLTGYTHNVPAGRPQIGHGPPFDWEEGAVDALTMKGLDRWRDWSIGGMLYQAERYNGFGYRLYHPDVLSPYLWSGTNHYTSGGYHSDSKWSSAFVDQNPGVVAILKRLAEQSAVAPRPTYDRYIVAKGLQTVLSNAGLYTGRIDGDWGRLSRGAYDKFNQGG